MQVRVNGIGDSSFSFHVISAKKKIQNTLIHVLQGKFTFAYLCAWPTFANLILTCASDFRLEKFRFKFQIDKNLKTTFKS